MKRKLAVIALILCLAGTSTAFARGYGHRGHGGYHGGSHYYGYRGHRHHGHGLGIAFGVAGGLLLGSALLHAATPPPRTVVYGAPYAPYQPGVIVRQPGICVEDRAITGEWRINRYNGRQFWVPYQYPVVRRFQVPCY